MNYLSARGRGVDVFAASSRAAEVGRLVRTFMTSALVGVVATSVYLIFTAV